MKIWIGPTGSTVRGHVLDVNKEALERTLRDYDDQLYIRWNPKKREKQGVWEIRRRPNKKSIVEVVSFEGMAICRVEYKEWDIENHVLDVTSLNYDVLTKLKSMDLWNVNQKYFVDLLESKEASHREENKLKARSEMRYRAKQMKREVRELRELILSGMNPAEMATYWNKAGSR